MYTVVVWYGVMVDASVINGLWYRAQTGEASSRMGDHQGI